MNKYRFIILGNEIESDSTQWIEACRRREAEVDFRIVNISRYDWLERILEAPTDYILTKPSGLTSKFKQLYDERSAILARELNLPMYPTIDEILIYENKRYFSYWLKAHHLPCPLTKVFYNQDEALKFLDETGFPVVAKINIGASGKGVKILNDRKIASDYVKGIFNSGQRSSYGPRFDKGNYFSRLLSFMKNPEFAKEKLSKYKAIKNDVQQGFVLLQEYIPHTYEWRVVRIGKSFFAHKKIRRNEKASGSLIKQYDPPPFKLLNFAKEITDRFNFFSMAIDLFEDENENYLINEMQCIFGQSDPYQMLVDSKPGRYLFKNNKWVFEEGDFNTNQSFDLRLDYVIESLKLKE
jgi:glutathione synthase/RimK-type ligase-like ATP-grasp enzyme